VNLATQVECARQRLQEIVSRLEQTRHPDEGLDQQALEEMRPLIAFLRENGYLVAARHEDGELLVTLHLSPAEKTLRCKSTNRWSARRLPRLVPDTDEQADEDAPRG